MTDTPAPVPATQRRWSLSVSIFTVQPAHPDDPNYVCEIFDFAPDAPAAPVAYGEGFSPLQALADAAEMACDGCFELAGVTVVVGAPEDAPAEDAPAEDAPPLQLVE